MLSDRLTVVSSSDFETGDQEPQFRTSGCKSVTRVTQGTEPHRLPSGHRGLRAALGQWTGTGGHRGIRREASPTSWAQALEV